ncbi:DUF7322 domain-containing protein [Halorarius halobius]|uniref:DUF7322 domain-containing protein n=1 Tax=Halorarius halobius TaxID=2962671 RepID=UPI0020CC6127|nr:hypothetical protein [Halorarius halobius]
MSDERRKVKETVRDSGGDGDDPWPDEPSEFDPSSLGPDPTTTFGSEGEEYEVDDETSRAFWAAVVLANVGLFGVTVGPMLWYFEGATYVGGGLFAVGAVALARTYAIQRRYSRASRDSETAADGEEP